jgi:hypothetical protein
MAEPVRPTRRDVEARLIAKAWKDEAFAGELRTDPRAAIARELAVDIPADLEIKVLEETPTTLYLVVPPKPPAAATGELTDDDLEQAAGGQSTEYGGMYKSDCC